MLSWFAQVLFYVEVSYKLNLWYIRTEVVELSLPKACFVKLQVSVSKFLILGSFWSKVWKNRDCSEFGCF